jgi:hypothetical protein
MHQSHTVPSDLSLRRERFLPVQFLIRDYSLLSTRTKITKKTSTIIMGTGASTHNTSTAVSHGSLKGANLPPVCTTDTTAATAGLQRSVQVKLSPGQRAGSVVRLNVAGRTHSVEVPANMTTAGGKMWFTIPDPTKVYASTLPAIPGMAIVLTKPIAFGSVSFSYTSPPSTAAAGTQQQPGEHVGRLMQEAQEQVLLQAAGMDCNAVLGMSFTVTNDSWGECGYNKIVIVTACGTPCVVTPQLPTANEASFVRATAVIVESS